MSRLCKQNSYESPILTLLGCNGQNPVTIMEDIGVQGHAECTEAGIGQQGRTECSFVADDIGSKGPFSQTRHVQRHNDLGLTRIHLAVNS